jgi:uncharacterized Ntn-hydrolase superfamily protein
MKNIILTLSTVFLITSLNITYSQDDPFGDTFSICAVDLSTGQVGSAGASCIAGSIILSDVHPGVGVIHTQAYYLAQNQSYARQLMNQGLSPQQIIDSVVAHDYQSNPTIRQYGVVDNVNGGRYASYTGVNCTDWKGHLNGMVYSIQGNILLGEKIVDSMKTRFLNTPGQLAVRLMAALQGAKVPGADTRCTQYNKSTISAFLRVANTNDPPGGPYWLDLNVNNTPTNKDPIDSLQVLFNNWLTTGISNYSSILPDKPQLYQNYPNPFNPTTIIKFDVYEDLSKVNLVVYNLLGIEVAVIVKNELFHQGAYSVSFDASKLASGVYLYKLTSFNSKSNSGQVYTETKKMALIK